MFGCEATHLAKYLINLVPRVSHPSARKGGKMRESGNEADILLSRYRWCSICRYMES